MSPRTDRGPTPARTPTNRVAARNGLRTPPPAESSRLRRQANAGRMFVPSALTILAICAGMTAIRFAANGNVNAAMALVVAAALLDGLDGRVARMMGATSKMGAEIDSLADVINFGVVPAFIIYLTLMKDHGTEALDAQNSSDLGWLVVLIYCCAIVLRLARFNTLLDDDDAPAYTRDFFVGVPAPAAAICVLLPVGLQQQFGQGWWTSLAAVSVWTLAVAYLAACRIPTASFKAAKVSARALPGLLIGVAVCAALFVTFPYLLMIAAILGYLLHIPFAVRNRRWVASRPEHWDAPPAQRRAERRAIARTHPGRRVTPRRRQTMKKSDGRLGLHIPTGTAPATRSTPSPAPDNSPAPTEQPEPPADQAPDPGSSST